MCNITTNEPMMLTKIPSKSSLKSEGSSGEITPRRSISFEFVEVHEFPILLGTSNVCSEGCPVTMGMDPLSCGVYKVDDFEEQRSESRRETDKLRIPVTRRAQILLSSGYSLTDIASATLEAEAIRRERANSLNRKNLDRFQYVFQSAGRKLKKVLALQQTDAALSA